MRIPRAFASLDRADDLQHDFFVISERDLFRPERRAEVFDEAEAEKLEKRMRDQTFTLGDFRDELRRMKKMGPLEDLLKMIPGAGKALKGATIDPKQLDRVEAIINSMTREERQDPWIIDGSRRRRIDRRRQPGRPLRDL